MVNLNKTLLNNLLAEFKKRPITSRLDLIKQMKNLGYNHEKIESMIWFLLEKKIIKKLNSDGGTLDLLQVLPRVKPIDLPEMPKKETKIEDLCISFPYFDALGFPEELNSRNINYCCLKEAFENAIYESRESIQICSPFFEITGTEDLVGKLIQKSREGVKIKILSREFIKRNGKLKSKSFFSKVNENWEVKDYHFSGESGRVNSSIHAKFIVFDTRKCYLGSGELRKNSFIRNFEIGVILKGGFADELSEIFRLMFKRARRVKIE